MSWIVSKRSLYPVAMILSSMGAALWIGMGGRVMAAEESREAPSPQSVVMDVSTLPVPNIGVRQDDLRPIYGEKETLVWIQVPQIPGCVLDAFCYEWSNLEYVGQEGMDGGRMVLRHRWRQQPNVLLMTTVTPSPGAVEFEARAVLDEGAAPDARLPDALPIPNFCFRVKRADGCFASYPYPFPDFIARSFIFTERGRTFLTETGRLRNIAVPLEDPRNNPPWVQVYVAAWSPGRTGPAGKTWYNVSPDRFTVPVIGVVSRDGKHLAALACAAPDRDRMTQAWQECFHNNPKWAPPDGPPEARRWRLKVYVMPNDPDALLRRFAQDFPDAAGTRKDSVAP